MATARFPDGIEEAHTRRRATFPAAALPLLLLGAVMGAALTGLFGGTGAVSLHASGGGADLIVRVPTLLRSGMFFEMEIEMETAHALDDATIALAPSVWRNMTINTTVPEPGEEEYKDGAFRLNYGPLEPGGRIKVKVDGQINPDLFAGTRGDVAVFEKGRRLVAVPVRIRVLP